MQNCGLLLERQLWDYSIFDCIMDKEINHFTAIQNYCEKVTGFLAFWRKNP
jgi:hypothetical protein